MEELISIKTRQVFREYMVGWVLREIADEFDAARIDCDLNYEPREGGQRRTLVEQYYHTIDWTDDKQIKKVLQVYETIIHEANQHIIDTSDSPFPLPHQSTLNKLMWRLEKDGLKWTGKHIVTGTELPHKEDIKKPPPYLTLTTLPSR